MTPRLPDFSFLTIPGHLIALKHVLLRTQDGGTENNVCVPDATPVLRDLEHTAFFQGLRVTICKMGRLVDDLVAPAFSPGSPLREAPN